MVDGKKTDKIPTTALGQNNKYYSVNVDCPSSKTEGLWDYNAWKLNLDYIESNSKCNLTFTSNLTKEDYDKYIEAGVATRRNTYRGKDITSYKSLEATNKMNLYNQISNCTFDDIYVGDYIIGNNGVTWLIADINNYLHSGNVDLTKCHATIIPAKPLTYEQMNTENTTGVVNNELVLQTSETPAVEVSSIGSYLGSKMKQDVLPKMLIEYVNPDFGDHILQYTTMHADQVDLTIGKGVSSRTHWYYSDIDLMSEVNVYGSIILSSSSCDIGTDNSQYAIFALKPEFINSYGETRFHYWLKGVAYSPGFVYVNSNGLPLGSSASFKFGVRPRFLID